MTKLHRLVSRRAVLSGLGGVIAASVAGCTGDGAPRTTTPTTDAPTTTSDTTTETKSIVSVDENGSTAFDGDLLRQRLQTYPTNQLSDAEVAGLLYMREEEKLAHDLYTTLSEGVQYPIFANIAQSEQTHADAVLALLEKYDLEDPALDGTGAFSNTELQSLYDSLLDRSSQSEAAALRVGAAVEEIDILDLEDRIAETDETAITLVYENLLRGSRNHLRAFVFVLDRRLGVTYEPVHLSSSDYQEIIGSPMETGWRGGQ